MSDNLENLNEQQKDSVVHESGPLLIVAGAGTGKTTVITRRIAHLIETKKCQAEEILALTFTDKSAGEMEERVDQLLPYGYVDLWISTFHSFAEKILHEHGTEIGLPGDFKVLSETSQWMLVRKNLDKFELKYFQPLGNPTKHIHNLLRHFSRAKDENISVEDYKDYVEKIKNLKDQTKIASALLEPKVIEKLEAEELNKVVSQELEKLDEIVSAYKTYQQLLLDNQSVDFGDLINYTLKLFQDRKAILAKYRAQFKYILVDEFQDTNFAQYELIKLLAAPDNNITVVGDDDQAIYKFRGASISNILQFKEDYPKAKEVFLNNNYRSSQDILDLSYKFIQQNNPYRLEVKLAKTDSKLSKKLIAQSKDQGEIRHIHGQGLDDEASFVAEEIIKLYNSDQDLNWSDFAVLVRANASATDFMHALDSAKIPYHFLASRGLYAKRVIMDVLAFLRLLDNYHESLAVHRVISWPLWGIRQSDIVNFNYWANRKGWSLFETVYKADRLTNISDTTKEKIPGIMELITKYTKLAAGETRATEIIQTFLDESGYLKHLTKKESTESAKNLSYLNQFFKKVQDFEKESSDKSIKGFLDLINLESESGETGSLPNVSEHDDPNTVKIMTVHASKGLEFDYVFLPNMVDKKFPSIERSDPIKLPDQLIKESLPEGNVHLQEERRLLYVAMTRAKKSLYFSSAEDYGGVRKKKLSRFLDELKDVGLSLSEAAIHDTSKFKKEIQDKEDEELKPKLPAKFSFTRLKAYETCPYQYQFSFILKVPTQGKPQFSFGRSMHNAMQKLFQLVNKRIHEKQPELLPTDTKTDITLKEVVDIYKKSFIDDWYPTKAIKSKYFDKGQKSITEFYNQHKDNWPEAMYLEYPFNLPVKGADGKHFTIYGVVDRIDKVDGGLRIVDYKTGSPKTKLTFADKEQLLIYQMAIEAILQEPVTEVLFHYFDDNTQISFKGTDKELEKVRDKILNNIEGIKSGDFTPKPGPMCKFCDFNSICDFKAS
jgi:DNA helicase-2/ATP-dependent DNA helicase PcrA